MSKSISHLKQMLADTYVLYFKTQSYHWNVESRHFYFFHAAFEEQYQALALAVDELAERIRMLGERAPTDLKALYEMSNIGDAKAECSKDMLQDLHDSHQALIKALHVAIKDVAGDDTTEDLLLSRLAWHEKTAWMLASSLK